ncbi:MAG TPA: hypothetical protein VD862_03030 [Candidatus Paceibacterota bacterium]|nr:hypothetical protein [Candidatus Paceibacterota bacterium]
MGKTISVETSLTELRERSAALSKEIIELEHRLSTNAGHDELGSNAPEDNATEAQSDLISAAQLGEKIAHLKGELTAVEDRIAELQKAA